MLPSTCPARTLTFVLATAAVHWGAAARVAVAQQEEPPRRAISIEVHNDNFHDATVYALRAGLRQRLGFVNGNGKDTFKFLWREGELRVEIDFIAAGRYFSQLMDVQPGDELKLTILPHLHTLPSGTVF